MYFGADHYPEHWPEEFWKDHARLMREANINVVRLAEFAWAKMEPREGSFDFGWLDDAIGVLAEEGIGVILGTPTATPPKWLMDQKPDMYMQDELGQVRGFGSRRHYCHNNPGFRRHTKRMVTAMAEHYRSHPNVVLLQIDNEFGCCDLDAAAMAKMTGHIAGAAKVSRVLDMPHEGIEAVERVWGKVRYTVLMNHTGLKKMVAISCGGTEVIEVITGVPVHGSVLLDGYGVAVLREESQG